MRPSLIPIEVRIRERVAAFFWNRKYKEDLKGIREALLKTDFNDGSNVDWGYGFYTWYMVLRDKEGERYDIGTAWRGAAGKSPLKIYATRTVYDGSSSKYYEIDLDTLLTGSTEEISKHVQYIKNELQEQPKIETYFVENVGKMSLVRLRYEEDEEGKKTKVLGFYLGGHMNEWDRERDSFITELELVDKEGTFGGDVLDTKENRRKLATIVEAYGEGTYKVRKYSVRNKEIDGTVYHIIQVVEIYREV